MTDIIPLIINNQTISTPETFPVTDPRTGETLWNAYSAGVAEVDAAADAAQEAFPAWAGLSYPRRRDLLNKAADIIEELKDELITISEQETAAGIKWSSWDVNAGVESLREAASRVSSINGEIPPTQNSNDTALVYKAPYGVILAIVPWNAAVVLAVRAIAYALAAGNTVIFKSSELSPRTHFLLADAFRRAGFPSGVVNLLTHSPHSGHRVIPALIQHPAIRKISFTGSTSTGRIIGRLAGEALKPTLLELGGTAPAIILDDADLTKSAHGVLEGSFGHAGQVCMATERVIILKSIEIPFISALKDAYAEIFPSRRQLQPSIRKSGAQKVRSLVEGAIQAGATIVSGPADYVDQDGRIFGPTILSHVDRSSDLYNIESFGPVCSLFVVDSVEDAIGLANDTPYGLAASVWSNDIGSALRVAKRLDCGTIQINDNTVHDEPTLPHGGFGASGFGRFGGNWGISEFQTSKYIRFRI